MITIEIDRPGIETAIRKLEATKKREVWRRAMEGSLYDIVEISKNKYLSGPRPGRLGVGEGRLRNSLWPGAQDSRTQVMKVSEGEVVGRVGTSVPYGRIHEYGTVGAGGTLPDIVPKTAKVLRFQVKTGGAPRWVSTKRVKIPPRPFIRPAIEDASKKIVNRFLHEIDRALEEA